MSAFAFSALLRSKLAYFIRRAFRSVSPGEPYRHNWHIDAIVHELMNVHAGKRKRLLIAQPPRSLKSICTSVAYVAWAIGHDPTKRIIVVSYSSELAEELHRQFRTVVESSWYRELFPKVRWAKTTARECTTTGGGGRYATSVGGTLTGRGADIIIIDDPMNASDIHSEAQRRAVIEWFSNTLVTRLNDKNRGAIIAVMQRLHEEDLAGHLLEQGGWDHLILPAIAEREERMALGQNRFKLRRPGDLLHSERESREALERIRGEIGGMLFSAQYQQQPVPLEGNLIRRNWFASYDKLPSGSNTQVVMSWDVATTTGAASDYSVCTVWRIEGRHFYLEHVYRERAEFSALRQAVIRLAQTLNATTILIEDAGPGKNLLQDLRLGDRLPIPQPIGIKPEGSKVDRMAAQTTCIEAGQVYLPKEAAWLPTFLSELLAFPRGKHDDQVDSVSQFLFWAQRFQFADERIGMPIQVY